MKRAAIAALVLVGLVTAPAADAGVNARLDGPFRVVGKITDSNDGTRGEVRGRTYRFGSFCPPGRACKRVSLKREGPSNSTFRSVLLRKRPGVYKGTERRSNIRCSQGGRGDQKVKLKFKLVRAQNGLATAFRGRAKFEMDCTSGEWFQKAKLWGRQ